MVFRVAAHASTRHRQQFSGWRPTAMECIANKFWVAADARDVSNGYENGCLCRFWTYEQMRKCKCSRSVGDGNRCGKACRRAMEDSSKGASVYLHMLVCTSASMCRCYWPRQLSFGWWPSPLEPSNKANAVLVTHSWPRQLSFGWWPSLLSIWRRLGPPIRYPSRPKTA